MEGRSRSLAVMISFHSLISIDSVLRVLKPAPDLDLVFQIPAAKLSLQIVFFRSDGSDVQNNKKGRNSQTDPDRICETATPVKRSKSARYIGFRENRNGPWRTIFMVDLDGSKGVLLRRSAIINPNARLDKRRSRSGYSTDKPGPPGHPKNL
jgi:hypothetical protein